MGLFPNLFPEMSIRLKLLGAFLVMLAGFIVLAGAAVVLQLVGAQRAALQQAEHVAAAVARISEQPGAAQSARQSYFDSLGVLFDRDIFLVDASGVVVAATDRRIVGQAHQVPEIAQAVAEGRPRDFVGPDVFDGTDARQVVVPLPAPDGTAGVRAAGAVVFEYTQVYDTLMAEAKQAALLTVLATFILAVLGWIMAFRVTHALVRPLAELERTVALVAAGNHGARLRVRSNDEVGRLAAAVNRMAADLQRQHDALQERNADLARSNALLQDGITRQQEAAERIEYLAYHDSLTALPNRNQFGALLADAVARAERGHHPFGLFFVDLDRFKQINDTLGHGAGDALLQEVARRLRQTLRAGDAIARLGGDEFVVLVDELRSDRHAEAVAHKILQAIARPFIVPGYELRVTASVGISRHGRDGRDGQTLMKYADIAMYQAKAAGKNSFAFYSPAHDDNSIARLELESRLRCALELGELELHYQPKLDLRSGRITGMEALLRWPSPGLGMVSPEQFIPVAEETGLIVPLGKWALRQACRQNMAWLAQGLDGLTVAVNLSPRQFSDPDLLTDIVSILHETGLDGRRLELEITESAIMQDAEAGRRLLRSLKSLGVRIAIDDFGTGYSSLSTLKQFPIDTLKIDRSFIADLATDPEDRGLTEAILQMARTLKLHVVAEGVENRVQQAFLRERGCDELQGFLFSKPLPAAEFAAFVHDQRQPTAA
ncbi:putative bifunctional diguanylate cyclase/phosphodiesterase [Pseudorhodoferax soli]|uniref:Diguanylate cyclase (GGDEF)-like protein n=1 Tax=Pseudorhodoferax soli TaxID=545864 RepID=A0A368XZV8_9BURK|nr:EAL domain-containing protein [Pseudorhodoferax soli]RCW72979.1 diguanylate cyclase (GGDEF)-like protein [Pseudorhodoferax soli]